MLRLVRIRFEVSPHCGSTNPDGRQSQYNPPSTENVDMVDGMGKPICASTGTITTVPQVESSQDGGGYQTLDDVPSVEDSSEVGLEEMNIDNGRIEKTVPDQVDGGEGSGLDMNGYLLLHHVPSPKNARRPNIGEVDNTAYVD